MLHISWHPHRCHDSKVEGPRIGRQEGVGCSFPPPTTPLTRDRSRLVGVAASLLPPEQSAARLQRGSLSWGWGHLGLDQARAGQPTPACGRAVPARCPFRVQPVHLGFFTWLSLHHLPSRLGLPVFKPPIDGKCECCHFNDCVCVCVGGDIWAVRVCVV